MSLLSTLGPSEIINVVLGLFVAGQLLRKPIGRALVRIGVSLGRIGLKLQGPGNDQPR